MTQLVPKRLQRGIEGILQTRLPATVADALLHHALDADQVLLGVAGELGDDLGPLVPRRDQPQLADRVEVEELVDEVLDDLEGAPQPRRPEVLHGHVFRHVQDDVEVPHHAQPGPARGASLCQSVPPCSEDELLHRRLHQAVGVLGYGLPCLKSHKMTNQLGHDR